MKIPIRLDEESKTSEQVEQRERTYKAATVLRLAGYPCEVVEYFTGDNPRADAAGIRLMRVTR